MQISYIDQCMRFVYSDFSHYIQISYIDQCMRFVVIKVTKYKSHTLINVSGLYEVKLILLLCRWPYIAEYLDSWNTIIYFSYYYNGTMAQAWRGGIGKYPPNPEGLGNTL